jgi:hypothetical protein
MEYDKAQRKIIIKPNTPTRHLGFIIIRVTLSDSRLTTEYTFSVTVYNKAPFFESKLRDAKFFLGGSYDYKLPNIIERENLPYKIST